MHRARKTATNNLEPDVKHEFALATYEVVAPHVAKIMQNRPQARNAQNNRTTLISSSRAALSKQAFRS